MQLIEVAVVAALRKEGVSLKRITDTREYVARTLKSEFPFAEYRFKTDGRRLFMDFAEIVGTKRGRGKLLRPDQQGQLAWAAVIGRLREFDYAARYRDSLACGRPGFNGDHRPALFFRRSYGERRPHLGGKGSLGGWRNAR